MRKCHRSLYETWEQSKQLCPHGRNTLVEGDPWHGQGPEDSDLPDAGAGDTLKQAAESTFVKDCRAD